MATADTIAQKLTAGLNPQEIDVQDVSHKHAGHAGWREGGGTHFEVTIKAAPLLANPVYSGTGWLMQCWLTILPTAFMRSKCI